MSPDFDFHVETPPFASVTIVEASAASSQNMELSVTSAGAVGVQPYVDVIVPALERPVSVRSCPFRSIVPTSV